MRLIFIFILLLDFNAAGAQVESQNLNRELYKKNKVKSVKVYESWRKNGMPCKKENLISTEIYDTSGQLIESFSELGFLLGIYHQQFRYDSTGKMTNNIGYYKEEPIITHYTYGYDQKNRVIKKACPGSCWYYTYDSLNNMVTSKWLLMGAAYPEEFFLDSFHYNSIGQKVKMTRYHDDGSLYFIVTHTYDDAGNKISETRFQHGQMTDTWSYQYDGNHHMISFDHYGSQMEKTTYDMSSEYNTDGTVKSRISDGHYLRFEYEFY
ncbi:MAG: hypothetical protein M3R17_03670 [Bacteroidota bacterium]|nr:hypothetical protein [Bacteroidota bacterium]